MHLALVAAGGAIGSLLRYLLSMTVQQRFLTSFPMGTLAVNTLGCFCMGVCLSLFSGPLSQREDLRLAVSVGLLGGFTTFSAFGAETFSLIQAGEMTKALLNIAAQILLGLVAVWAGYQLQGS